MTWPCLAVLYHHPLPLSSRRGFALDPLPQFKLLPPPPAPSTGCVVLHADWNVGMLECWNVGMLESTSNPECPHTVPRCQHRWSIHKVWAAWTVCLFQHVQGPVSEKREVNVPVSAGALPARQRCKAPALHPSTWGQRSWCGYVCFLRGAAVRACVFGACGWGFLLGF